MSNGSEITPDHYGISRVDDPNNYTFAWRVSVRRQGKIHVRNFPGRKCGSREIALEMAIRARQKALLSVEGAFWCSERGVVPADTTVMGTTGSGGDVEEYIYFIDSLKQTWL